jgi:hypothetical protein
MAEGATDLRHQAPTPACAERLTGRAASVIEARLKESNRTE